MAGSILLRTTLLALSLFGSAHAETSWPTALVDPAAEQGEPADLLLPMPCGASMAFQKVLVPGDPANPLADLVVWNGQDGTENGYMEARRPDYLRGPFDSGAEGTAYFIGRYELTQGQYRALTGDCAPPKREDRIARGNVTWLEAQQLADSYSRWLHETDEPTMPRRGMAMGFVRLPTETEWEYAARGGARVAPEQYASPHFFSEGTLEDYAIFVSPGSSRGRVTAVGLKQPNPLGLYDVYGNVEELMLEPYRLTLPGRTLGQPGGIVTRGGSATSNASQIYSAQRTEYTPYGASGSNTNPGIGVRFVLSAHLFSSDLFLDTVKSSWLGAAEADPAALQSPPDKPLSSLQPTSFLNEMMTEVDARHLLGRVGFGAHPKEIAALMGKSRAEAIDHVMDAFNAVPDTNVPFAEGPIPAHWLLSDLSRPESDLFLQDRRIETAALEDWWLARMADTNTPQVERMVLFWTNILNNSFDSTNGEVASLARNNQMLRSNGAGKLSELLKALLSDSATLRTYKADLNSKLTPDQTFAKFLVGLTGENAPVSDVAAALTGLGISTLQGLSATFEPWRAAEGTRTVFGRQVAGPDDLMEALANHPGTAKFITQRVWQEYVSWELPPVEVIDELSAEYISADREFSSLLKSVLKRKEFWAPEVRENLSRSAVDLLVSAVRSSGVPVENIANLRMAASELGNGLYIKPPPVSGTSAEDTPEARSRILHALFKDGGIANNPLSQDQKADRVFVRFASEDFRGPPNMKVGLYKRGGNRWTQVWQSESIPAVGGLETTKYQRGDGTERWQLSAFAIPQDRDYDVIGISFINDHCCEYDGKTGDRNFFVDWIQVRDERFSSRDAKVDKLCSNEPQRNGKLFCEGTIFFETGKKVSLPKERKSAKIPGSRLVAERSVTLWMDYLPEPGAHGDAALALYNPRFGDFSADSITLRLRVDESGALNLVLDPKLCVPGCLPGDWPVAARPDGPAVLKLPLSTSGEGAKSYDVLSKAQRQFVAAIWMALPDLISEAGKGQNVRFSALQRRHLQWEKVANAAWTEISASQHASLVRSPAFLIMQKADQPYFPPISAFAVKAPAGVAPSATDQELQKGLAAVTAPNFSYR